MIAAKKSSGKFNAEMLDIPVLQRKWQAALRPSETLPHYEDVVLGARRMDVAATLPRGDELA
jgi:hypothetical protein